MKYLLTKIIAVYAVVFFVLVFLNRDAEAEEYRYIELSQGVKLSSMPWGRSNWQGDYPTEVTIGYHQSLDKHFYYRVQFSHVSNILDGPPFNDRDETWLDRADIRIGVKW